MNVKQGQLAIIIGARATHELIGQIVQVKREMQHGEIFESNSGWRCYVPRRELTWVVSNGDLLPWRGVDGDLRYFMEVTVIDRYLRPVEGLPELEDITTGDLIEA